MWGFGTLGRSCWKCTFGSDKLPCTPRFLGGPSWECWEHLELTWGTPGAHLGHTWGTGTRAAPLDFPHLCLQNPLCPPCLGTRIQLRVEDGAAPNFPLLPPVPAPKSSPLGCPEPRAGPGRGRRSRGWDCAERGSAPEPLPGPDGSSSPSPSPQLPREGSGDTSPPIPRLPAPPRAAHAHPGAFCARGEGEEGAKPPTAQLWAPEIAPNPSPCPGWTGPARIDAHRGFSAGPGLLQGGFSLSGHWGNESSPTAWGV